MTVGVYKITNQSNGKVYIGQSVNVEDRIYKHKLSLKGQYHKNDHLQKAWNKYGEDAFKFELIISCKSKYLDRFEKLHIHINKSSDVLYGYNNDDGGNSNKTLAPQTINKMCKPRESVSGKNNPAWKDYPRIVKCGKAHGKQYYGIRYNGKMMCRSTNLNLLKEKLKNEDFTHIYDGSKPHIVKGGYYKGKQLYRIVKNEKYLFSSYDLDKVKQKLEEMS